MPSELSAAKPTYKPNPLFTKKMLVLELTLGIDLASLLLSPKSGKALSKMLGVDKSTITRWRTRLLTGKDRHPGWQYV